GKPLASHEVMHHVHESPQVMLLPLYLLAIGAVLAGVIFDGRFYGEEYAAFCKGALFPGAAHELVDAFHHVPALVGLSPF
ncbi:NADH-quinone oxidoreductase subunit L, partial [Rhizobium ruizarguesonis]